MANPKPLQQPHPPIWIGASGPQMLRIVARYADVWHWAGDGFDQAVQAGRELNTRCQDLGRSPDNIRWSAQFAFDGTDPTALVDEMSQWYGAGFTELVVSCSGPDPVRTAEIVAEDVRPALLRVGRAGDLPPRDAGPPTA